jgi:CheY-like chemotaxis protein
LLNSHRVLVVDDDLDTAQTLAVALREMGHQVRFAIDGYAALEVARETQPEFVFLDLAMPGIDGYEVTRRLKREPGLEAVRIFAMTGYGREHDRRRSREAGCDEHLTKPLDLSFVSSLLVRH